MKKSINVLSLFDGMRCGRVAAEKEGINISNGLEGDKSSLFYQYVRLLKEVKPKFFMLENVASMKNSDKNIITQILGVEPIMIDANLVSAQDRPRYFWTNIPVNKLPEDKKIVLKDIMQQTVDHKFWYDKPFKFNGYDKKIIATLEMKGHEQMKRVYNPNGKCGTLTACRGGNLQKKVYQHGRCRKLTPIEYEKLQGIPEGYTEGVADTHRYNMLGDGWNADVIAHIFSFLPDEWKI